MSSTTLSRILLFPVVLVLYVVLTPAVLIVIFINEICRALVSYKFQRFDGSDVKLIEDGADAIWGHFDSKPKSEKSHHYPKPEANPNSKIILSFGTAPKDSLNVNVLIKIFEHRVLSYRNPDGSSPYERLKYIITNRYGYACWKKDADFNLKRHFRVMNADKIYTEAEIKGWLATFSENMDETMPQWQFIIFQQYKCPRSGDIKSFLVIRFQHAYFDGLSFYQLVSKHWAAEFEPYLNPIEFDIPFWRKVLCFGNAVTQGPLKFISVLQNTLQPINWIDKNVVKSGYRNYAWTHSSISTDTISKIKKKVGKVNLTNIVSAAFSIALEDVLLGRKIKPTSSEIEVAEVSALLPYPSTDPVNRCTLFSYTLDLKNGEGPMDRLHSIRKRSLEGATGPQLYTYFLMLKIFGRFPSFIVNFLLRGLTHSVTFNNAPGAKRRFTAFGEATLLELGSWTPQVNEAGVMITTITYNELLDVSGCADIAYLSSQELQAVVDAIPSVIEQMAR